MKKMTMVMSNMKMSMQMLMRVMRIATIIVMTSILIRVVIVF